MHLNEEEPEAFLPQPGAPKVLPGQITTVGVTCSPFLAVKGIGAFTHIFFQLSGYRIMEARREKVKTFFQ